MFSISRPVAASSSLSILLHGVAFAALVLLYEQAVSTGQGVEIELIRSTMVSRQQQTEVPRKSASMPETASQSTPEALSENLQKQAHSQPVLAALNSATMVAETVNKAVYTERNNIQQEVKQKQQIVDEGKSVAQLVQSSNASEQQHSILELLHDRISDNKEYPYIARRQRREGIATVGFVLHPDGTIENAHLVTSSRARMLDRAALAAVKRIEPFKPAQDYLDQSAAFKIDVVFNLL